MIWEAVRGFAFLGCIAGLTYAIWFGSLWYVNRRKRIAKMWLDLARALTAKTPDEIMEVVRSHNKFLSPEIKQALYDRRIDLELDIETQETIEKMRKTNDRFRN